MSDKHDDNEVLREYLSNRLEKLSAYVDRLTKIKNKADRWRLAKETLEQAERDLIAAVVREMEM